METKLLVNTILELLNLFKGPFGYAAGPGANRNEIPEGYLTQKKEFDTIMVKHKCLKDYVHWA